MKKAKRFLTGLLSAALALSLCAMPAMADEGEGDAQTSTIKTSVSTIDESKTGSITIHKYLQKNAQEKNDGTGEDGQNAPTGAEAAEGVGFTVYQVMSKADLLNYYNGKGDTVTIDTYADVNKNKLRDDVERIKTYGEEKTNEEGVVKFDNLEIGLYVVIETYKPASVTQAVKPFLVSIPMTRKGEVKKGEEWLYDVVVYPKNSTTTGNFNLVKYGVIGNDRNNKTALEGVKFKLEHLKDGVEFNTEDAKNPENWELIRPKAVGDQPAKDYFVTDDAGNISVNDLKPGTYRFTEIGYEDGKDNKYIINENDQYVFVVDATGNAAAIPANAEHTDDYTVNGDTVSVYNYVPDVDKKVEKNGTWQEAADYSVGDSINYKIDVTIPENIERLKTFTVTDTPTGLTDNVDSIVVKDGGTTIENTNDTTYYKVKKNGEDGFIIEFVPSAMAAYKGKTLTITYTAVLNKDAVTTIMGNCNTVKLDYSKNVKQNGDEKPDTDKDKKTVQDETVVYTFKIKISKTDENGKGLNGVEFDLYKEVTDGTANAITGDAAKAKGLDGTKYWLKVNEQPLTTSQVGGFDGVLEVKGLENGTYKLVETKAKDGYNLLKAPVDVSLNIAYKTTWTETNKYENGVWVKRDVTAKKEKFDSQEATNGGTQNGSKTGDGVISTTIINRKGFNLPTTGGFGTLLFSGIGVLLVVAGVGVLLSLKKKNRA